MVMNDSRDGRIFRELRTTSTQRQVFDKNFTSLRLDLPRSQHRNKIENNGELIA